MSAFSLNTGTPEDKRGDEQSHNAEPEAVIAQVALHAEAEDQQEVNDKVDEGSLIQEDGAAFAPGPLSAKVTDQKHEQRPNNAEAPHDNENPGSSDRDGQELKDLIVKYGAAGALLQKVVRKYEKTARHEQIESNDSLDNRGQEKEQTNF